MPDHCPSCTRSRRSAPGQAASPVRKGTSNVSRVRARAARRRTSPGTTWPGGRVATTSTASSSAPTAVLQPLPGCGTTASRDSSIPYSLADSALTGGNPTSAHQAPSAEAAPSRASNNDTDPVTLTVLPRRSPPGSSETSAGETGSGGASRRPEPGIILAAGPSSTVLVARSSIPPWSNTCSTMSTCADQLVATPALASSAIAMTFRRGRGEDGGVSTRDLVVRPGDRVSASGRYVLCDDG